MYMRTHTIKRHNDWKKTIRSSTRSEIKYAIAYGKQVILMEDDLI